MASSGLKKDSKLKSLEIAIEQKKEECSKLETQLQKVGLCYQFYVIIKCLHQTQRQHFQQIQSKTSSSVAVLELRIVSRDPSDY